MSESYWVIPSEIEEKSPLVILREQANALTEATRGALRGVTSTQKWGGGLAISLSVVVPALDGYEVELVKYHQPPLMYPGTIEAVTEDGNAEIENESAFMAALQKVLSSPKMQKMIAGLLAQGKQPETPKKRRRSPLHDHPSSPR